MRCRRFKTHRAPPSLRVGCGPCIRVPAFIFRPSSFDSPGGRVYAWNCVHGSRRYPARDRRNSGLAVPQTDAAARRARPARGQNGWFWRLVDARAIPGWHPGRAPRRPHGGGRVRHQPHGPTHRQRSRREGVVGLTLYQQPPAHRGGQEPIRVPAQRAWRGHRRPDHLRIRDGRVPAGGQRIEDRGRFSLARNAPARVGRRGRAPDRVGQPQRPFRRAGGAGTAQPGGFRGVFRAGGDDARAVRGQGDRARRADVRGGAHRLHRRGWVRVVFPGAGVGGDLGRICLPSARRWA